MDARRELDPVRRRLGQWHLTLLAQPENVIFPWRVHWTDFYEGGSAEGFDKRDALITAAKKIGIEPDAMLGVFARPGEEES